MLNNLERGKEGEQFVEEIISNSFLRYWVFPNPIDARNKEICDLLILFNDVAIMISIKNHSFNNSYSRYFKRTIHKAEKQIKGAERNLFKENQTLNFKRFNGDELVFYPSNYTKRFRIIVNLGEGVLFFPLSRTTSKEQFITIFDKDSFISLVSELDTFPDFIEYLEKREQIFLGKDVLVLKGEEDDWDEEIINRFHQHLDSNSISFSSRVLISGSEKDLLALYLRNKRTFPGPLKKKEYKGMLYEIDGEWNKYSLNERVKIKEKLDSHSYFIDELVKREILTNSFQGKEKIAIEFLSLNRFYRRVITRSFFDFYRLYEDRGDDYFARRYGKLEEKFLVFIYYPENWEEDKVDTMINVFLESLFMFYKYKLRNVIVIGTIKKMAQFKLGFIEGMGPFPENHENELREICRELGWFQDMKKSIVKDKEFPDLADYK